MAADRCSSRAPRRAIAAFAAAGLLALCGAPAAASPGTLEGFSECVAESGAVFYGAHWCPYCAKQKQSFGEFADRLPYVECYEPGSRDKRARCADIRRFPTWTFADGSVRTGALSLAALAAATGCTAP
jgi:hypothetical protein